MNTRAGRWGGCWIGAVWLAGAMLAPAAAQEAPRPDFAEPGVYYADAWLLAGPAPRVEMLGAMAAFCSALAFDAGCATLDRVRAALAAATMVGPGLRLFVVGIETGAQALAAQLSLCHLVPRSGQLAIVRLRLFGVQPVALPVGSAGQNAFEVKFIDTETTTPIDLARIVGDPARGEPALVVALGDCGREGWVFRAQR